MAATEDRIQDLESSVRETTVWKSKLHRREQDLKELRALQRQHEQGRRSADDSGGKEQGRRATAAEFVPASERLGSASVPNATSGVEYNLDYQDDKLDYTDYPDYRNQDFNYYPDGADGHYPGTEDYQDYGDYVV